MKFRIALLTATVLAAPFAFNHAAKAQPVTGLYVGAGAGYNAEEKFKAKDQTFDGATNGQEQRVSLFGGYTGEAAVGYGFGNGFRVEVEGDYIQNRIKNVTPEGPGVGGKGTGVEQKYGGFLNAYYDFDVGVPYLYPYIGGGVGYQIVRLGDFGGPFPGANTNFNKGKGVLAYQGIAGVAIPIAPIPGLSATVEYRMVGIAGSRKYWGNINNTAASFKVLHEYNNEVLVGVRYAFGVTPPAAPAPAPAPAPVAAPAPAPAKTYLVFFDWDKSNLTPRAIDIIAQAASDSHTQQTTNIQVNGYTDTSGTPTYNMGLSQRRAQSVAAQLVTDGVPQSEISIQAFGETHLLVPTGPGVREPQNRRVQIILQ
jgi:OOP family OmpA-OmpF porin